MSEGGRHIDVVALPLFLHNGEALGGLLVDPGIDNQRVDLDMRTAEYLCYAKVVQL